MNAIPVSRLRDRGRSGGALRSRALVRDERGQATAEYALVMVAAAAIALALIVWATSSDLLPEFFNAVIRKVADVAGRAPI